MALPGPQDQFITIDGQNIRYIEFGKGRPVIVLHQLAVYGSADHWRPYSQDLAAAGRIYALDMPGWGRSSMPPTGYSFDMWINVIRGFCDAKGLAVVDLFAMSLGAWICALFASEHPGRVRRMALLDCPGLNPALRAYASDTFALPSREDIRRISVYDAALADAIYDAMNQPGRREAYIEILRYVGDPDVRQRWSLRERLPEMPMPMLFTNYDTDTAIPVEYTLEAFQLAPVARLSITATGFGRKAADIYGEHVDTGIEFLTKPEILPARRRG
ncbi:MAG: alpha/beta fold hydrolase [Hyphomonadaceae bacterium]